MLTLGKKGISPLIATVLLIVFAVALGTVVMNWGRSYVEETVELAERRVETGCGPNLKLEFLKIAGAHQLCARPAQGELELTVENTGLLDIYGMEFFVVGERGINSSSIAFVPPLRRAALHKARVSYSPEIGQLLQLRIVPTIKFRGVLESCPGNALVAEQLELCV